MNKLIILIFSLMVVTAHAKDPSSALAAAQNIQADSVSPQEAATLVSQKQAVIVDVREDDEWQAQHIPDALHIPLGQLNNRLAELDPYKQTRIITQCQKGGRSKKALEALKAAGFSNVYNLDGGLAAWDKAGLKTTQ